MWLNPISCAIIIIVCTLSVSFALTEIITDYANEQIEIKESMDARISEIFENDNNNNSEYSCTIGVNECP